MSALYLKDLAQKTRRGPSGRVREGRSAGGLSYGNRIARGSVAEPSTGERVVDSFEADGVRNVFADFAAGKSPRAIAAHSRKTPPVGKALERAQLRA